MHRSIVIAVMLSTVLLARAAEPEIRTWTSRNGKTIEAKLVRAVGVNVTVEQADGTVHTIGAQNLSQEDIDYVKDVIAKAAEEETLKREQAMKDAAIKKLEALGWKTGQQEVSLPESLKNSTKLGPNFYLYIPEEYGTNKDGVPLLLFLHGAGEQGTDIKRVMKHGIPKLAPKKKFPFITVSPQCQPKQWWDPDALKKLVDYVTSELQVDHSRTYITGLSMGGYGTWAMITEYPDFFAAAIPICGGGNPAKAKDIKDLPIWVFHGDADTTIPVKNSQDMVDALKKQGSSVKFTIYPGVKHDSWTRTYNNDEVYKWLLNQQSE